MKKTILYISGSIGLGHVSNDYAIAQKFREINPNVDIIWIATNPADQYLIDKGESLHSKSHKFTSYSSIAEKTAGTSQLNLVKYVLSSLFGWTQNVIILKKILREEHFDIIVGNETYEIIIALIFKVLRINVPFIIIYDFLGLESMTKNPIEKLINYILNFIWSRDKKIVSKNNRKAIFIGEPADIPNNEFGFMLPNRRKYAIRHYEFIGYVTSFDPNISKEKLKIKEELGYGIEPLIVCSIGGTSIGKDLLELCMNAFPILKKSLIHLKMIIITGPRLSAEELKTIQPDIEVKGFVPNLYKYFAACDFAIVQGGGTSTMELSALNRPFIYFPIKDHSEQKLVAERLTRFNAGIRMDILETTPLSLAENVLNNFGKSVPYNSIDTSGASKAAKIINQLML